MTPSTKRVSHRGSLLKGVAVYRVLYQSILNAKLTGRKNLGRKRCTSKKGWLQPWEYCQAKLIQTLESFTRSGLKLESVHQESPRSDVFRKRATKPLLNQRQRQKHLTWAVEKKTQWSKVLFSDESKFCISFGNKVPESGGRVERHRIHVAWSPVWSFHSQWWFGLPCHLLVWPLCFLKSTVNAAIYQEILEHFMLPSADKLYGDADFIFQQDLAPAHTAKGTKSWFNDHGVTCLIGQQTPWPEPHRESMGYCQEEDERHQTQQCRWPEGHCQRNLGFHTTSAVPQTDHLHATPNWGSN